ncbi:beta-N-acetylhexosaminidase, partial [Streptomyces sp. SID14478]|nr:beta-N-acetylhexosaminidase [Streptomyces sp. SID14478]
MDLLPAPRRLTRDGDGSYLFDSGTGIAAGEGTEDTARWLRATLGAVTGLALPPAGDGAGIRLSLDPSLAAEAYRLRVDEGGVAI